MKKSFTEMSPELVNLLETTPVYKVTLMDRSEYRRGGHRDPDRAWYATSYSCISPNGGLFKAVHTTSVDSELEPYCPVCGEFEEHFNYTTGKFCCGDFECIDRTTLIERTEGFLRCNRGVYEDAYFAIFEARDAK